MLVKKPLGKNVLEAARERGFQDVPGFPGYMVHPDGSVLGKRGWILKPIRNRNGYWYVNLYRNGKLVHKFIHSVLLETFVGPRPDGLHGCHKDDNKNRNVLSNLEYGTPSKNGVDAVINGRNPIALKTHCRSGHEFTPENTRWQALAGRRPRRKCRKCNVVKLQEYRDAAKDAS